MNFRRGLTIVALAGICLLATPSRESEASAGCVYPFVQITQYWGKNHCGSPICTDVMVLVGESGVDCAGNAWSWGNTTSTVTYRKEWCEPICD